MKKFIIPMILAFSLLILPVNAAETDSDQIYCFTQGDFSEEEPLVGICVTDLPESHTGTVFLGSRVVQPGDILTAQQVDMLTFCPVRTEQDTAAQVTYLPIYDGRVAPAATMTIGIRGKTDNPPVAEDFTLETYKNLPLEGRIKSHDPEGESLTYTVLRQPRRGTLDIRADGSFTYTPKKNKVGVDSFTYTTTDPAGKVSREATVTIQILKPTDDQRYADTAQFEAEWLRNTGIFQGEKLGNQLCFQPEKTVTRGEFLTMVMRLLNVPFSNAAGAESLNNAIFSNAAGAETLNNTVPSWLQPYWTAAMRSGLLTNFPEDDYSAPISAQEAATLLQNVGAIHESPATDALAVMNQNGLQLEDTDPLTRQEMAVLLYQVHNLAASPSPLA